jgi:flagellar biosynthetic protein FliQ
MPYALAVDLARDAILHALLLSGPLLVAAVCVGLAVGVLQAVTQIQEQTIPFVAKLVTVAVVFLVLLTWLLQIAVKYTTNLLRAVPAIVS